MTQKLALLFVGALATVSCGPNGNQSASSVDATGVYVREYAIEISNPETGKKIGMRQVRDSIFIEPSDNGYQVSNRKWRMNDYDQDGWVSMAHADDRPLPTFFATYDGASSVLKPENSSQVQPIFVEKGTVFKDKGKELAYHKIE
jgi:hypothetical protein